MKLEAANLAESFKGLSFYYHVLNEKILGAMISIKKYVNDHLLYFFMALGYVFENFAPQFDQLLSLTEHS